MTSRQYTDPMEKIVADALDAAAITFVDEHDPRAQGLDFYLPDLNVYIEVKQMHAPRIALQMAKVENIIAIQGLVAAKAFAAMVSGEVNDPL